MLKAITTSLLYLPLREVLLTNAARKCVGFRDSGFPTAAVHAVSS
jgi:hypothetical protein